MLTGAPLPPESVLFALISRVYWVDGVERDDTSHSCHVCVPDFMVISLQLSWDDSNLSIGLVVYGAIYKCQHVCLRFSGCCLVAPTAFICSSQIPSGFLRLLLKAKINERGCGWGPTDKSIAKPCPQKMKNTHNQN